MTSGFYSSVLFLVLHGGYIGVCFVIINLSLTYSEKAMATPVLLPGKSHGRRSLVGCSPWGR